MDLRRLEGIIGMKYEKCKERVALTSEKRRLVNKADAEGRTLLMEAAGGGATRCVDFLLRCGAEVNALDKKGKRAIDHAFDSEKGSRPVEAILLLLQRDSLLPDVAGSERGRRRFEELIRESEGMARLFAERDRFHGMVRRGDVKALRDTLRDWECHASVGPRHWANRDGKTALCVSVQEGASEAWSFLRSQRFEFAGDEERAAAGVARMEEATRREADEAMGNVPESARPVGRLWKGLPPKSKAWVLGRTVDFQGRDASLKEVLEGVVGTGNAERALERVLDSDGLSVLLDGESFKIGRPLFGLLERRRKVLLRGHQECFIPRTTKVRKTRWNQEFIDSRTTDAFFICDASKSDVWGEGIAHLNEWDGGRVSGEARCFLLGYGWNLKDVDPPYMRVIEELKVRPCVEGGQWQYAHFFHLSYTDDHTHHRTEDVHPKRAAIIAGVPGSGKSVVVNARALERKEQSPGQWVDLIELSNCGEKIGNWNSDDFTYKERVEDLLFELISGQETRGTSSEKLCLEKNIFKLFCHSKESMVVYFDGFDDMCARRKEIVTSFLTALLEKTKVEFVVASRDHESSGLERRLSVLAQVFAPLSREELSDFFNREWNARLQSLKKEEMLEKAERIASTLQSNVDADSREEIGQIVESLKLACEEGGNSVVPDVDFGYLAETVMKSVEDGSEVDGSLCEIPFASWILASVAFEANFDLRICLSLDKLFRRFSEIMIGLCIREKAESSDVNVADALVSSSKSSTYTLMKTHSAFFFLEDESCRLKGEEVGELLRVGLLARRGHSTGFAHGTIGEYFLSLWLLEKAGEEEVTRIITERILPKRDFEKVRRFLDSLLLTDRERKSAGSGEGGGGGGEVGTGPEVSTLNSSAFPAGGGGGGESLTAMQKCVYNCILECNWGILLYLAESWKAMLPDVIFGEADWNLHTMANFDYNEGVRWSALILCGGCISRKVINRAWNASYSQMEYLEFLRNMLRMLEDNGLISNLRDFVSTFGLQWTGVEVNELWKQEWGRAHFKWLSEFLSRNKDVLGEPLATAILEKKGEEFLEKCAVHVFDTFAHILDSILEGGEWKESLPDRENLLGAWTRVVRRCGLDGVGRMWRYLEGMMGGEKGRFLRGKDRRKMNALCSACFNAGDPNVLPYVWGLAREVFDFEECRALVFNSFDGVKGASHKFVKNEFLVWLFGLLEEGIIDGDEASRLVLVTDQRERCYALMFHRNPPTPPSLYRLQELLLTGRLRSADVVKNMQGHYRGLSKSCFSDSRWNPSSDADFASSVESEWEALLSSLESSPLLDAVPRIDDQRGSLPHASLKNGEGFDGLRLKAFLVLLERQCRLEERIVGREGIVGMFKGDLYLIRWFFPRLRIAGDKCGRPTRALPVPFFFAVVSKFLPRELIAEILVRHRSSCGSVFHDSLRESDPRSFLSLYDVARWSLGDRDALWDVHAVSELGVTYETVMRLLLEVQQEGLFEFSENDGADDCEEDSSDSDEESSDSYEEMETEKEDSTIEDERDGDSSGDSE